MNLCSAGALGAIALLSSSCGEEESPAAEEPTNTEPLLVGFVHPLTGNFAAQSAAFEQSVRLAQQQINDNGGIRGRELKLSTKDDKADPMLGAQVTQELLDEGCTAIIGSTSSQVTQAMLGVTVPAGAIVVTTGARASALTSTDNDGLFFRPGLRTADEGVTLADAVSKAGFSKVSIVTNTSAYSGELATIFETSFKASSCSAGPCTIASRSEYDYRVKPDMFDFSPLVKAALDAEPDTLLVATSGSVAKIVIKLAWDAGYRGKFYTTEVAGNENLSPFLSTEQAAQVRWLAAIPNPGPSVDFLRDLWTGSGLNEADFGAPVFSSYDATFVLGLALAHANTTDPAVVKVSMHEIANPPGLKVYAGEWKKALAAIKAGQDIDYEGVNSPVDFDDMGDVKAGMELKGYDAGKIVPIDM